MQPMVCHGEQGHHEAAIAWHTGACQHHQLQLPVITVCVVSNEASLAHTERTRLWKLAADNVVFAEFKKVTAIGYVSFGTQGLLQVRRKHMETWGQPLGAGG